MTVCQPNDDTPPNADRYSYDKHLTKVWWWINEKKNANLTHQKHLFIHDLIFLSFGNCRMCVQEAIIGSLLKCYLSAHLLT